MFKLIRTLAAAAVLLTFSAFASAQIGAISYPEAGKQKIYAFLTNNGVLQVNYWNGSKWQWANQGKPADTTVDGTPGVMTYKEGDKQKIYAFVKGANGNLYVNYWNGSIWQWADQGKPPNTKVDDASTAITFLEAGKQRIYSFVSGVSSHVYTNYWDGTKWQWAELPPLAGSGGASPGVTTFVDPASGKQRIYAFILGGLPDLGPGLALSVWDGTKWQDGDCCATPPTGTGTIQTPSVTSYLAGGTQRFHVFMVKLGGTLLVHYWNGSQWQWAEQGQPPGTDVWSGVSAITYLSGKQQIYAFVTGKDNRLYANFWDGSQWQWADFCKPQTALLVDTPAPVSYPDPQTGKQQIYVFVKGKDGNLYLNYGDSVTRRWSNQGKL